MSETTVGTSPVGNVNPAIAHALLAYVETALGAEGLQRLASLLAGRPDLSDLTRSNRWWSIAEFGELVVAGYEVTGDLDLGQRVGQQTLRDAFGGSVAELLAQCGTTEVACAVMADYATRMEPARTLRVIESSTSHVVLEGITADGTPPNNFTCGFSRGYFAAMPELFGNMGTAVETACQARGAPACLIRVAWRPDPTRRADHQEATEDRVVSGQTALEQLEETHAMAARLVDAHEVGEVLDRVVNHVSGLVGAPQYVLSVRLDDDHGRRVHHVGFQGDDAEILIDMLEAGERLSEECAVVKVCHGDRTYGHLVAVFPPGATSSAVDRRFLRSYADYAASAIQIVDALSAAQRDRDTANALLELAGALAVAGDVDSVARKLCDSLPGATGCEVASVWLFDPDRGVLQLADVCDGNGDQLDLGVPTAPVDLAQHLTRDGAAVPYVLEPAHIDDQLASVLPRGDGFQLVVAPIVNGEHLIGVATVALASSRDDTEQPEVMSRLRGLTDQAVVAFENARLVDEMRHQALHDDLTGLPKRALADDRCRLALSRRTRTGEHVSVLFVDVDDFKSINDSYGHAAGDLLLQQLSARLSGQLRSSDTCARVGGDEFVVILSSDPARDVTEDVAERFLRVLEAPFDLDGRAVCITVSIGIAAAHDGDDDFEELVKRADGAMYAAKAAGKGQSSASP